MHKILLLLALLVLALAPSAGASQQIFNDPLLTQNDQTDHLMLSATLVSTTQSSVVFEPNGKLYGVFTVVVSACTTCNITYRLEAQDPDGTWYSMHTATAITATGTYRYMIGVGTSALSSELIAIVSRPLPARFRVQILWNSGTSASYTVQGVAF